MTPNSSLIVSSSEPQGKNRKKVWIQNTDTDKKIYVRNSNDVYEEFVNKVDNILWTNPDPTSEFAGQTITLNDDLSNYSYYEIIYKSSSAGINTSSTGKVKVGYLTALSYLNQYIWKREVSSAYGKNIIFLDCIYYTNYGNYTTTVANTVLIPLEVIGYKY